MGAGSRTTYTAGNGQQMTPQQWAATAEGQKYGGVYPGLNVLQSGGGGGGSGGGPGAIDTSAFTGAIPQAIGYGNSIMQTAMDPQNALYSRTQQQLTDQTRAGLEARGLDTSGVGAGIENNALSNFNIDWQNNLLSRQVQGAQAYSSLGNTATGFGNVAQNAAQAGFTNSGALGQAQYSANQPTPSYGPTLPYGSAVPQYQDLFATDAWSTGPTGWSGSSGAYYPPGQSGYNPNFSWS